MKRCLIMPVVVAILSLFLSSSLYASEVCDDETEMDLLDYRVLNQASDLIVSPDTELSTGELTIGKTLIAGNWRVACDVMGDQAWVPDAISNPSDSRSAEGHQLAHCGQEDHWIIWLDTQGRPFLLQELLSGATGGTLDATVYTDSTYTEIADMSTIQPNERIYWTTQVGNRVWHHTGVTVPEIPEFTLVINEVEYTIKPGEILTLEDLPVGTYTIIEKYNPKYFIANVSVPFTVNEQGDVVIEVEVTKDGNTEVQLTNQMITPDPPTPQTEITPVTESESESESETESEVETETETETESETEIETESEVETESETEKQKEETEKSTEKNVILLDGEVNNISMVRNIVKQNNFISMGTYVETYEPVKREETERAAVPVQSGKNPDTGDERAVAAMIAILALAAIAIFNLGMALYRLKK